MKGFERVLRSPFGFLVGRSGPPHRLCARVKPGTDAVPDPDRSLTSPPLRLTLDPPMDTSIGTKPAGELVWDSVN